MFMSADEDYVKRLFDAGKVQDQGDIYAYGRIAIYFPSGSPLKQAAFPDGVDSALSTQPHRRFAIANPELAPYGRAAKDALVRAGVWNSLKEHLIFGESIAQTAQFCLSGSVLGGVIAYSQALDPLFSKGGSYRLIPSDWHKPLGQRMALVKTAGATARRFYDFIRSGGGNKIFLRNGYTLP